MISEENIGEISEENIGEIADYNVRQKTIQLLQEKGPNLDKVLLRLRQALNAKETKVIKLKGAITKNELPKGFDLIINTGLVIENKDGESFGTGESLVSYDLIAHGHRLKAVDLALQLHDAMPSLKHEHTGAGGGPITTKKITDFPKEPATIEEWEDQVRDSEKRELQVKNAEGVTIDEKTPTP